MNTDEDRLRYLWNTGLGWFVTNSLDEFRAEVDRAMAEGLDVLKVSTECYSNLRPEISFTVPGAPVGKERPRVTKFGTYTPKKTAAYEKLVGYHGNLAMAGRSLILRAVGVYLDIRLPIPKSWPKKLQKAACDNTIKPILRLDMDNIEKAILDALNGIVWKDDAQVVQLSKEKCYSVTPGVDITIWDIE